MIKVNVVQWRPQILFVSFHGSRMFLDKYVSPHPVQIRMSSWPHRPGYFSKKARFYFIGEKKRESCHWWKMHTEVWELPHWGEGTLTSGPNPVWLYLPRVWSSFKSTTRLFQSFTLAVHLGILLTQSAFSSVDVSFLLSVSGSSFSFTFLFILFGLRWWIILWFLLWLASWILYAAHLTLPLHSWCHPWWFLIWSIQSSCLICICPSQQLQSCHH